MQVNRIQQNNNPSFNARLEIKDAYGIFEKHQIDFLRSKAAKIGTEKDFIKVELGNHRYGEYKTYAEQGIGWITEKEMDSVNITVNSIINKENETNRSKTYAHHTKELAEGLVDYLVFRFEKFADKLKK